MINCFKFLGGCYVMYYYRCFYGPLWVKQCLNAADLVGIDAVDLSELLHCPLGPPGEGGGATKPLHLCNEELMWPRVGH